MHRCKHDLDTHADALRSLRDFFREHANITGDEIALKAIDKLTGIQQQMAIIERASVVSATEVYSTDKVADKMLAQAIGL